MIYGLGSIYLMFWELIEDRIRKFMNLFGLDFDVNIQ